MTKISDWTTLARASVDKANDIVPILDMGETGNSRNKKMTVQEFINLMLIPTFNAQSGTSYTLVLTDAFAIVECDNAAAITLTIPANADVAFPIGTMIQIHQRGAGAVTITPDTGVALQSRGGLVDTAGQYAVCAIVKRATDTWVLTGDIA